tara:strand:- start:2599 stop:2772 length:174 start_codon:yes stop_codon:yes gene_type:complete
MNIEKNKDKKALWIDEDLHKEVKLFAIKNNNNIEATTQYLIKLGICTHKQEQKNDTT